MGAADLQLVSAYLCTLWLQFGLISLLQEPLPLDDVGPIKSVLMTEVNLDQDRRRNFKLNDDITGSKLKQSVQAVGSSDNIQAGGDSKSGDASSAFNEQISREAGATNVDEATDIVNDALTHGSTDVSSPDKHQPDTGQSALTVAENAGFGVDEPNLICEVDPLDGCSDAGTVRSLEEKTRMKPEMPTELAKDYTTATPTNDEVQSEAVTEASVGIEGELSMGEKTKMQEPNHTEANESKVIGSIHPEQADQHPQSLKDDDIPSLSREEADQTKLNNAPMDNLDDIPDLETVEHKPGLADPDTQKLTSQQDTKQISVTEVVIIPDFQPELEEIEEPICVEVIKHHLGKNEKINSDVEARVERDHPDDIVGQLSEGFEKATDICEYEVTGKEVEASKQVLDHEINAETCMQQAEMAHQADHSNDDSPSAEIHTETRCLAKLANENDQISKQNLSSEIHDEPSAAETSLQDSVIGPQSGKADQDNQSASETIDSNLQNETCPPDDSMACSQTIPEIVFTLTQDIEHNEGGEVSDDVSKNSFVVADSNIPEIVFTLTEDPKGEKFAEVEQVKPEVASGMTTKEETKGHQDQVCADEKEVAQIEASQEDVKESAQTSCEKETERPCDKIAKAETEVPYDKLRKIDIESPKTLDAEPEVSADRDRQPEIKIESGLECASGSEEAKENLKVEIATQNWNEQSPDYLVDESPVREKIKSGPFHSGKSSDVLIEEIPESSVANFPQSGSSYTVEEPSVAESKPTLATVEISSESPTKENPETRTEWIAMEKEMDEVDNQESKSSTKPADQKAGHPSQDDIGLDEQAAKLSNEANDESVAYQRTVLSETDTNVSDIDSTPSLGKPSSTKVPAAKSADLIDFGESDCTSSPPDHSSLLSNPNEVQRQSVCCMISRITFVKQRIRLIFLFTHLFLLCFLNGPYPASFSLFWSIQTNKTNSTIITN